MSTIPFGLQDNQNSNVLVTLTDQAGNAAAGAIDAGSLAATSSDPAAIAITIGADGASFDAKAEGPLDAAVVVTATCTVGGVAFTGTETFDVGASAPTRLVLSPSTPVAN